MIAGRVLLLMPFFVVYGALLIWPLGLMVRTSMMDGTVAYNRVVHNPLLRLAITNTIVIWKSRPVLRVVVLALVLLPFWTGVLVKNFAWAALLQDYGVVNTLLRAAGLARSPLPLLHNRFAVIVGMVHYVLPYAVFPIFAAMASIDDRLEKAAASLGASRSRMIGLIVLPLTLPGVYAAVLLVFIISTGFFITPLLLGGPRDMMAANLVDYYARQLVDFRAASALAVMIIVVVSVLVTVYQWLPREGQFGSL